VGTNECFSTNYCEAFCGSNSTLKEVSNQELKQKNKDIKEITLSVASSKNAELANGRVFDKEVFKKTFTVVNGKVNK